jgi:hypothetical protein
VGVLTAARPCRARALFLGAALLLAGCGGSGTTERRERVYQDEAGGYRYVIPDDWLRFTDELRSIGGSIFITTVLSLEEGDPEFLSNLPDSMIPQLEGQARYYFSVVDPPSRREMTVGGEAALELTYPVRVRAGDPQSTLVYWVFRHEERLYVLRASYVSGLEETDSPAVMGLLESWEFL